MANAHHSDHHNASVDPIELARAQAMWAGFIKASKIAIVVTVAVLALLGATFINW